MDKLNPALSDKAVGAVLTAPASMSGTSMVPQRWMQKRLTAQTSPLSLNPNQRTSLTAMIGYISRRSGQSEFRLERRLSDHFNVPNAKCLSANDFDDAIRYLADIVPMPGYNPNLVTHEEAV